MSGGDSLLAPLRLSWRMLRRDLAAGEMRVLFAALVLAACAVASVGFVTDRAQRALVAEANRLLGGDAVLRSDQPIGNGPRQLAASLDLSVADTASFRSMLGAGGGFQLCEVRALDAAYPLRGSYRLERPDGSIASVRAGPEPGTAWLSRAGAQALGAVIGDELRLGRSAFELVALVDSEPDAALDYFNTSPRVFIALADLPATGLVQPGSRIGYRLAVAGEGDAVAAFERGVRDQLDRGLRLETASDARPEIRSALDRADRFLGLAAMLAVILAGIAVAIAARRHAARHLDGCAVLRCLGASQRSIALVHLGELALVGVGGALLGVLLAFVMQAALGGVLARSLGIAIPQPGSGPALQALVVSLVVLAAFAAPPVLALRRVSALRVLRRELGGGTASSWLVAIAGIGALLALLWWRAGSAEVGALVLGGFAASAAVLIALALVLVMLLRVLRRRMRGPLRYGLANLGLRPGSSAVQVAAIGLGLMAILLLTLLRTDLLARWQDALPDDAPNRFVINVQPDQLAAVRDYLEEAGIGSPTLFPMVRARLVAVNGREVSGEDYADRGARARRLAEREFNLSWTDELAREDNRVVAGAAWPAAQPDPGQISVEAGFAETLGWKLGDRVRFDVAGEPFEARISSLREVDWESFRPNFFVVAAPGGLERYPASWISAFHLPAGQGATVAGLVQRFPNLSVIDVEAVLEQVRSTAERVSRVVEVVFWFTLAAGVLVLLAAVGATQDERLREGAVMRVLGARRSQLRLAQASEFAALGLIAGLVAAIAASTVAGLLATRVFDLPWTPNWPLALGTALAGVLGVGVAGLLATRRVVEVAPSRVLRALD